MKNILTLFIAFLGLFFVSCFRENPKSELPGREMKPVLLSEVSLDGEMGRRMQVTIDNNLLKLRVEEDFILPFQEKNRTGGYIGAGKLVDASVKFAFYGKDPALVRYKEQLVNRLLETREPYGYIGMMEKKARMIKVWDIHEMGYIILGLVNDFRFFGEERSLEAAGGLADYIMKNWDPGIPGNWENIAFHVAVTGLDRAFLTLYEQTGNPKYIEFIEEDLKVPDWEGTIVMGRKKKIKGHIYAYMTRTLAQLELNSVREKPPFFDPSEKAVGFITQGAGAVITGGAGQWECWTNDQDGGHALGETCATAYQMRFYEKMLRMKHDPFFGDLMERTLYNALFAAQSPGGRKIRYYTPIEGDRQYFDGDTYCCPNNYRRIVAEIPQLIYYTRENGIAVNLYEQSMAEISLNGNESVTIKQETGYPASGVVRLVVKTREPLSFPLWLRIPGWSKEATVSKSDGETNDAKPGSFHKIEMQWSGNDTIILKMPMEWRFIKGRKRQSGRVALMRGPLVYCLNPALNSDAGLDSLTSYALGRIIIDPESVQGPFPHDGIRPGGTSAAIGAWYEGHGMGGPHDMKLLLTEFPDPEGKVCYFSVRDFDFGEDDELFARESEPALQFIEPE